MKKVIVVLACCALVSPLAFGQSRSANNKKQTTTTTEQTVTVTGTTVTAIEEGTAASYQPAKTLVVRQDSSNKPGTYAINGRGHIVNKKGEIVESAVQPGSRVRVYYTSSGDLRVIDHVVLLD